MTPFRTRTEYAALVLAAAFTLAACSDAVAPPSRDMTPPPRLSETVMTWQCLAEQGTSVTQAAPGNDGSGASAIVAAPEGEVVTRVAVKAGAACWYTPEGATRSYTIAVAGSPCFAVEGIGTPTVTVTRIGESPTCKNVTHVEYVTAPAVQPGRLQICKEIVNADLGFLVEPFTFLVAGTQVTVPARLYPEYPLALSCAEPIELAAGEHAVTEQRNVSGLAPSSVTSDPADRVLAVDLATSTATVLVVDGKTTVITFTTVWLPDPET